MISSDVKTKLILSFVLEKSLKYVSIIAIWSSVKES